MLEVRIFRFNAKNDVLRYYKPYFFENYNFKNLQDLLEDIKKNDPYFDFEGVKFVKINGVVASLDTSFDLILNRFKSTLIIEPLSTKRAVKDLIINDDDFIGKIKLFSKFYTKEDAKFYESLKPYFYAGFMNEFEPNFIGSSAIIFAKFLCEKYPDKKDEILAIVSNSKFGVWIAGDLKEWIFWNDEIYKGALEFIKSNLKEPKRKLPALSAEMKIEKLNFKHDLKDFTIASYGEILDDIRSLKAKFISTDSQNLPCGFELIGLNDELAFKLAGEILFDAFDSGADFLLVDNEQAFYMFDTLSNKLQKSIGRSLEKFYILRTAELVSLANGEIPTSIKNHKLKVRLV
ncbi:DUF5644 domain-containing protein [Campylobacter sp. MOP51]|uniref:HdrB C-terminal domain-containing protein n=1 Tax=Campylobacter canis TaxID=3378588 RepID=UPI003C4696BA